MLLLCDATRTACVHTGATAVRYARAYVPGGDKGVCAETDKHSFRPSLITRCVIYHARVYNAKGQNEFTRPHRIVRRALLSRAVLIIDAIADPACADSRLILIARPLLARYESFGATIRVGGWLLSTNYRRRRRKPAVVRSEGSSRSA